AESLQGALNENYKDVEFQLYIGLKHINPFIEDPVEQMNKDGIDEAVTIVLAPHYSNFSVGSYNKRAQEEADKYGIKLHHVEQFYNEPAFIEYWTTMINDTLQMIPKESHDETVLIVSAHSLPEKIKKANDPYPDQLEETARILAEESDIKHVSVGWQSEGQTGEPWLGPDVQDLTRDLYNEKG
ncbi:ferrochelatase, partial [Bacillus subtilis]|uniref:ferrochelatase n=1 Tax=Bacillus subtilis TaxID=1423 RepID=UPI00397F65D0